MKLELTVPCTPVAQPRIKARVIQPKGGGRAFAHFYTPAKADGFKDALILSIHHTAKPDFDNVAKAICDAMTTAGLWKDDAQVCRSVIEKWYVAKGARAGVWLTVERLP